MKGPVTVEEEQKILRLLRDGVPAYRIVKAVGRSARVVDRVRDENGIAPLPCAVAAAKAAEPRPPAPDPPESEGVGLGDPWIPPPGYSPYAERPDQARWKAMCAAATPDERFRLQVVMCTVLGIPNHVSQEAIAAALMAEHRTAEVLAGLYITARGRRAA